MAGGRPSKKLKLVRHTSSTDSAAAHVHRHRIFALQRDGEFALRTSYLPANPLNISDSVTESSESHNDNLTDLWNEDELAFWLEERQSYLDELIHLEGRGGDSQCWCGMSSAQFRCEDCFSVELACRDFIVQSHYHAPLHRIKSLGLCVQLGHRPGEECNNRRAAYDDDFVVINVHGIHEIKLNYCGCGHAPSHYKQLLRLRWFPATTIDPRTAATFAVIEFFHLLSFKSKVSAYEFYHSLTWRTDNVGTEPIRDRYSVFLCIMSEWRHLKALKQSGRGHDPAGIEATHEGELAVLCPACSQPGKNLPEDWQSAPPSEQWLYALFLAIDAEFSPEAASEKHMHQSQRCEHGRYEDFRRGLLQPGVGTVDCARHDMKLPNGVGDLQKGEKYLNMDYLWYKKLWNRMPSLPLALHLDHSNKFHLDAHIKSCQTKFSFNWTPWVGRTGLEKHQSSGWANINCEMGPGARRDTLDDHFGNWNWKKISGFGEMLRKIKEAVEAENDHRAALQELKGSIESSELGAASIIEWQNEVEAWEADCTMPNPFDSRVTEMTQPAVRLALAQQDARELEDSNIISLHAEVTPSVLISTAMDLEHTQANILTLQEQLYNCHIEAWTTFRPSYYCFKAQNIHGQGANTRAHKTVDTVEDRLAMSHAKYCRAHKALLRSFQPLKKSDLRPMGDFGGQTQGTAIMSWIWLTHGVSVDDSAGLQDSLRIEWCKARARHNRWHEEIRLLMEEMRHAYTMVGRSAQPFEQFGFVAYAKCQGAVHCALLTEFREQYTSYDKYLPRSTCLSCGASEIWFRCPSNVPFFIM
ncbi:hypothetical protein F4604DRAFT_1881517 [Suillus subluteus]|nr:hypothetical protein F4604DRAFT_1881517 [Suillus subluteus]